MRGRFWPVGVFTVWLVTVITAHVQRAAVNGVSQGTWCQQFDPQRGRGQRWFSSWLVARATETVGLRSYLGVRAHAAHDMALESGDRASVSR
ncbi:MAG: hypothetical protein RMM98_10470 [Acidobacteriota bacterium]|nr:hypothetical protein [Blastocatellia bacterium]MDW8240030.1 hypothetical protein [Acidobacteriota bacterium]